MSLGFDPAAFWGLTLRLYMVHTDGALDRIKREHGDRAWQAWWTAAMPTMKKFPALEDLIGKDKAAKAVDTEFRLRALSASLPRITQAEWRARQVS